MLIAVQRPLQECIEFLDRELREDFAQLGGSILSRAWIEASDFDPGMPETPDFRHSERGVDWLALDHSGSDVNFHDQIGPRRFVQLQPTLPNGGWLCLHPVALVRLDALLDVFANRRDLPKP